MGTLWQDVRFGFRMMARNPGVTFFVVLILSVGIAANTSLFSAIQAVMLDPLPYPHQDRLMTVWSWNPELQAPWYSSSAPDYHDWAERNAVFDELAAMEPRWLSLTGDGDPLAVIGWAVTPNYFATFETPPALGRGFTREEAAPGGERVVVLSHALWADRFGADPAVLGRTVTLNEEAYTIVGVAQAAMSYRRDFGATLYVPFPSHPDPASRGERRVQVLGRLKPGVSHERAVGDMRAIAKALEQEHGATNKNWSVKIIPLHALLFENARLPLFLIYGAVTFVLLIACVNAAGLLLARSAARGGEIAIRAALGASRGCLIRQMLTESAMLSVLAGGLGLLLTAWSLDLLRGGVSQILSSGGIAGSAEIRLNPTVLFFCLLVSIATGLLAGLAPAFHSTRLSLSETLKARGAGRGGAASRTRFLSNLVILEFAVALVLLVGAGLMARSFHLLRSASPGFDATRVIALEIGLPQSEKYREIPARAAFANAVLEKLGSLPGVISAGSVSFQPMSGNNFETGFGLEGRPPEPSGDPLMAEYRNVSVDYFSTMRIPILRGRSFSRGDDGSYPVLIVNEEFVRRYLPAGSPLGKKVSLFERTLEIVGVVGNARYRSLTGEEDTPFMYEPIDQVSLWNMTFLVRTELDPGTLVNAMRSQIWSVDPLQPILHVRMMEDLVAETISPQRLSAALLGGQAAVALLLAVMGIYGVMSFAVSQRSHEIGVRMALGARVPQILQMILGRGMVLAGTGIGIGLVAALGLCRLLGSLLYGIGPTDLPSYVAGIFILALTALAACYLPARRAASTDPVSALREE